MIKIIKKAEYNENKLNIQEMITSIFKDDNDKIANVEETMEHLDFIFSQEKNEAFLLLDIRNDELICMVNFLEYNNVLKDWCLFSVFTKKDKRRMGYAEQIIKEGIKIVEQHQGKRIVAGIEYDNISSQKLHEKMNFKYEGMEWEEIDDGFPENHMGYIYYVDVNAEK